MLQHPNDKVRHCYIRAAEARERALRERDPVRKENWFKIEERWITVAQSCALAETLSDFNAEVRRFLKAG
jgi:hypothetical protein